MVLRVEAILLALSLASLGMACNSYSTPPEGDCFWDGTAIYCDGDCNDYKGYKTVLTSMSGDGTQCWDGWFLIKWWTGDKRLCCKESYTRNCWRSMWNVGHGRDYGQDFCWNETTLQLHGPQRTSAYTWNEKNCTCNPLT